MQVHWWSWAGFGALMVVLLSLDLGLLNRKEKIMSVRQSLLFCAGWVALSAAFAAGVWWRWGRQAGMEYIAGYVVEESLSIDNLFVFLVFFNYFKVPRQYQQRVLFWGILGAIVLRGIFIFTGVWLLDKFEWLIYAFGVLLIYTAIQLARSEDEEPDPEKNLAIRLVRKVMPVTTEYHRGRYFVRERDGHGRRVATPLFVVVIALAATDVVFAADSIPTILGITQQRFIVFTSNIFAVMGLRSIFFALSGIMGLFYYLDKGLCAILLFVGCKMLWPLPVKWFGLPAHWAEPPIALSLGIIVAILAIAIAASLLHQRRHPEAK